MEVSKFTALLIESFEWVVFYFLVERFGWRAIPLWLGFVLGTYVLKFFVKGTISIVKDIEWRPFEKKDIAPVGAVAACFLIGIAMMLPHYLGWKF